MTGSAARKISTQPETVWFVARGSSLKGPYTSRQLEEKIQKKEIGFFDYCWKHGFSEWRLVSSLDEFDRRESAHRVPAYPSVEVPCVSKNEGRALRPVADPAKRIEIQFSKGRRQSMTAYEWAAALLFAVFLSYFAADFALEEVRSRFLSQVAVWELGHSRSFGEAPRAVVPQVWEPLFSAPGFSDVVKVPNHPEKDSYGYMPVKIAGHPRRLPGNRIEVAGWEIVSPSPLRLWDAAQANVDPVYSQRVELQGYLSPRRGSMIFVKEAGDPGLFANP